MVMESWNAVLVSSTNFTEAGIDTQIWVPKTVMKDMDETGRMIVLKTFVREKKIHTFEEVP
jgi:hypothetical protein